MCGFDIRCAAEQETEDEWHGDSSTDHLGYWASSWNNSSREEKNEFLKCWMDYFASETKHNMATTILTYRNWHVYETLTT